MFEKYVLTHIFIHFFTHIYIKNTQISLLKLLYQTVLNIPEKQTHPNYQHVNLKWGLPGQA